MATLASVASDADAPRVLSEAVERIAGFWQLPNAGLGTILGLSGPIVSRLRSGSYRLEAGSKPFELAQHLLQLFRSLNAWLGQDDGAARSWLRTPNLDLGAAPMELIATVRGLLRTSDYVDDLRAQTDLAALAASWRGRVIRIVEAQHHISTNRLAADAGNQVLL